MNGCGISSEDKNMNFKSKLRRKFNRASIFNLVMTINFINTHENKVIITYQHFHWMYAKLLPSEDKETEYLS